MDLPVETGFGTWAVIIACAALIHGAVGIGFPLVATPVLSLFMDVRQAVVLLVIPTIAINIANIVTGQKWGQSVFTYWPLAFWGIIGSYAGTRLLLILSDVYFRPLLALLILFYLGVDRTGMRLSWISRHPGTAMTVFGFLAGLCGGMVNVMLPPLIIYALETQMPKDRMIRVFNLCFLAGKSTQGSVLYARGHFTGPLLDAAFWLCITGLVVMCAGMVIRRRIKQQTYQSGLKLFLGAVAVLLLIKSGLPFFR